MPIKLSQELQQALHAVDNAAPIRLVDPESKQEYVLIRADVFEKLRPEIDDLYPLIADLSASEAIRSGLLRESLVSCNNLFTVHESRIQQLLGRLDASQMQRNNEALQVALSLK